MAGFRYLILCLSSIAYGHTASLTKGIQDIQAERIYANLLIGSWRSVDSSNYVITFYDNEIELVLNEDSNLPYYFMKDSNGVLPSGYSPNWPPYEAKLYLTGKDTLEITYAQLGVPNVTIQYIRK